MNLKDMGLDQKLLLAAAIVLLAGFSLFRVQGALRTGLENARQEYRTDLELSRNAAAYRAAYEKILGETPLPGGRRMEQNELIASAQELIRRHDLSLASVTPVAAKKAGQPAGALVSAEGKMTDLLGFLNDIAGSPNRVYLAGFTIARGDAEGSVRAEMTLSQR